MAESLLITTADIVKFTSMNGGVDVDKFVQYAKIAQDVHIQNYLGTKLFRKIQDDIEADTLIDPYLALVTDFVKPMLIHWTMVEYLPYAPYTIANGGVFLHSSENSEGITRGALSDLLEAQRNTAQGYTQRFLDFICANQSDFPEYSTNTSGDMFPDRNTNFTGWEL